MSVTRHVVLNHVDSPLRVLLWTRSELLMILGPILIGFSIGEVIFGTCVTGFNIWANRQYKRRFGKGQFHAVWYWYLPHDKRRLEGVPPSYIREYLG